MMELSARSFLTGALAQLSPNLRMDSLSVFQVMNIRFWDGTVKDECLYIAKASELPETPPQSSGPIQLLCIEDKPVLPSYINNSKVMLVTFPSHITPTQLFNTLNSVHIDGMQYALKLSEVMKTLRSGELSEIIDAIGHVFLRPVVLFSANLQMLHVSKNLDHIPHSTKWAHFVRSNYYPNSFLCKQLSRYKEPVVWANNTLTPVSMFFGEGGELFCPIVADHEGRETLGYLFFDLEDSNSFPGDETLLSYLCRLLAWRMWRHVHLTGFNSANINILLRQILDGNLGDDDVIAASLAKLPYRRSKNMVMICILPFVEDSRQIAYDNIKLAFEKLWPTALALSYNTSIVFIVKSDDDTVLSAEVMDAFEQKLIDNNCNAGISDVFHDLDSTLKQHFRRAVTAAIINSKRSIGRHYSSYTDIALYNLIRDSNASHPEGIRDLIDPCVLKLLKIDRTHDTNYLTTLRCYWHFSRRSELICDFMHIHRSTLFYRMNKLKQILQKNLDDYNDSVQLSISVAILEFFNEIPPILFTEYDSLPPRE